jgi:hypothetical protein
MSQFSNPAGTSGESAAAYTRALMDLLGDQEPLVIQAEQLEVLGGLVEGLPDSVIRQPEREGKWSIIEVLQHLADTEVVYAFRVRMALAHEEPALAGFDQDLWATRLGYVGRNLDSTMNQLACMRRANLELYRTLTAEQWQRGALHAERGRESVLHMVRMGAAHDLLHRRQIERIRSSVG